MSNLVAIAHIFCVHIVWFDCCSVVTYGANHIKFWTLIMSRTGLTTELKAGHYGKSGTHTILGGCFLPSGLFLSGNEHGNICVWRNAKCIREVNGHGKGPVNHRPDGSMSHSGVRCFVLQDPKKVLLTGGADG